MWQGAVQGENIDGILIPPRLVLNARRCGRRRPTGGLGDLMAVDVGGATTDVFIAKGLPTPGYHAAPARAARQRTMEEDGRCAMARPVWQRRAWTHTGERVPVDTITRLLHQIQEDPSLLPQGNELSALDYALAVLAVRTGLIRHAGTLTQVYTPMGAVYRQEGKDLTEISRMVVTGGTLIYSGRSQESKPRFRAMIPARCCPGIR